MRFSMNIKGFRSFCNLVARRRKVTKDLKIIFSLQPSPGKFQKRGDFLITHGVFLQIKR